MNSKNKNSLTGLLDQIDGNANGNPVEVGDLIKAFRSRGFGPLLLVPALLTILPTGAIPGVPAVCGFLMACISFQLVIGLEHPWLPRKLKIFSLPRQKIKKAIKASRPFTRKADRFLHSRLEILTEGMFQRAVGLIIFLLSVFIIFIGFVPLLPALCALPIFFFALGYSAHDGILIATGLFFVTMAVLWTPLMFGN